MATKAEETQGKGSALAAKAVETQCKNSVLRVGLGDWGGAAEQHQDREAVEVQQCVDLTEPHERTMGRVKKTVAQLTAAR